MNFHYRLGRGAPISAECPQCKRDIKFFASGEGPKVPQSDIDAAILVHYESSPDCLIKKTHDL